MIQKVPFLKHFESDWGVNLDEQRHNVMEILQRTAALFKVFQTTCFGC